MGADTVTFAYVDPGHATAVELHSWGAAHGQLWVAAEPGKVGEGLTVKQEMRAIKEAIAKHNREFLGQYGGLIQAGERYKELLTLPEAELVKGVSIDGYSTYRATRFSEPV